MSDAENDATLDGGCPPSGYGDRRLLGHSPPAPGAAPWERFSEAQPDSELQRWQPAPPVAAPLEPRTTDSVRPDSGDTEKVGSHAEGRLTVAELIAKVGAPPTDRRGRHHLVAPAIDPAEDVPPKQQDSQVAVAPAYRLPAGSEFPDLTSADYPAEDDPEPDAPKPPAAPRRLLPKRLRRTSTPPARQNHAPKRQSRRRPVLLAARSLAALFAVLAVVLTGAAWQWSASKNNHLNTVSALDPHSVDIRDPGGQYGDEDFLIVGMDSRAGENANMGAGDTDDADGARSDTVMLVNIPANRKRVVVVSFPRDLAITPIQCEAWNPDNGKYGPIYDEKSHTWGPKMVYTETKLNSTFSYGGPKCLVKEIQKLSGLSINRFIAVDFAGFAKMVEALGGVEVCSKTALHDYELGTVLEHGGRQIIDGPTALNYVRARQVATEYNGDYGRIKRQQLFLSSLLRSLISADTLLDLNKLNHVVNLFIGDSYVDNVKTKDLVQLGQSLQGMAAGRITFVTVPTGVTDENGDEPPRTADMRALFDAIIDDDPLPLENDQNARSLTPTSSPTSAATRTPPPAAAPEVRRAQVATIAPQEVTVRVSNGTPQAGLAATATSQLERAGFNVMAPDDYESSLTATTVFFSPGNERAAATVASAFPNSRVQRASGHGQVVQVVLGSDFKSVGIPLHSGSPVNMRIDRNSDATPTKLPEDLTVTNAADTTCE
ncbi:MAG: LCP family protein [Mycobacterium sp.]|nr:LCP family protein [Mycobacterium sp.]